MYIAPYRPDDPRWVENLKLCTVRHIPEVINTTNFQFDALTSFGSTVVEFGGLKLTFLTTPTTSSTNVLLVIFQCGYGWPVIFIQ